MALNSLLCADVPLSNYSLTASMTTTVEQSPDRTTTTWPLPRTLKTHLTCFICFDGCSALPLFVLWCHVLSYLSMAAASGANLFSKVGDVPTYEGSGFFSLPRTREACWAASHSSYLKTVLIVKL